MNLKYGNKKEILQTNDYYNLLTGKNGWRVISYNGDMMNVEPQDYVQVYQLLIEGYTQNIVDGIDQKFDNAMKSIAKNGDLADIYCCASYLEKQLLRKRAGKAIIPIETNVILASLKDNLSKKTDAIKGNKNWLASMRDGDLYNYFSNLSDSFSDDGYVEMIDKSM